jgi:hypothetical protein
MTWDGDAVGLLGMVSALLWLLHLVLTAAFRALLDHMFGPDAERGLAAVSARALRGTDTRDVDSAPHVGVAVAVS